METQEKDILTYACEAFQEGRYPQALEGFITAYEKGYEREWILENVYNCYMSGNEDTFRETYEQRKTGKDIPYEECLLDFIPYKEGEYFVFDREVKMFFGVFSVLALKNTQPDPVFRAMEFSTAAIALDWDFRKEAGILTMAQKRDMYIICRDAKRCMSFWKIPELREYVDHITIFGDYESFQAYFHRNTSVYLPKIFCGTAEERQKFGEIQETEHKYRLTPEGRDTSNVLLSIAVPTARRGHLVLKRMENLLSMPYDAEIEIVVSKNCSDYYEEEYRQVSRIKDARFLYRDQGVEYKNSENWYCVMDMCCGKYVMIVSDEDDVYTDALEHYLRLLADNPQLSIVRPGSSGEYSNLEERKYGVRGTEAFGIMFLRQNYVSGLIVRRKDMIEEGLLELGEKGVPKRLEIFNSNAFFRNYPHEFWCALLCKRGDAVTEPVTLIYEGKSVSEEELQRKGLDYLPFATYKARIQQYQGQLEFVHWLAQGERSLAAKGLELAIAKTSYLLELSRKEDYDIDNFIPMVSQYTTLSIKEVESFDIDEDDKLELLKDLEFFFKHAFVLDMKLREAKGVKG